MKEEKAMSHENPVPVITPRTNRPTFLILTILLVILILLGAWFFLHREGKARSNPTDGHTELWLPGAVS
jgi:hypothetical protein